MRDQSDRSWSYSASRGSRAAGPSTPQDSWIIMTLLLPTPTRRAFITSAVAIGASAVLSVSVNRTARAAPGETPSAIAFDGDALIVGGAGLTRRDDGGVSTPLSGPKGGNILSLATHQRPCRSDCGGAGQRGRRPIRRRRAELGGEKPGFTRGSSNCCRSGCFKPRNTVCFRSW